MEFGDMPLITEAEHNDRVEKYVEEIRDLKSALKYANALYHGKLLKIKLEEGWCPICGTVSDRQEAICGQKGGSLAGQPSFETPPEST
jgi:hypothetical protein